MPRHDVNRTADVDAYMETFNLRSPEHVHLVWHNGVVLEDPAG